MLAGTAFACVWGSSETVVEGKSLNGREKNSGEDNLFFSLPFKFRVQIFPAPINFPWVSENSV